MDGLSDGQAACLEGAVNLGQVGGDVITLVVEDQAQHVEMQSGGE